MKQQGITTGWDDGTFRPHDPVNRDAMAAFFFRYDHASPRVDPQAHFKDVNPNTMFYHEIQWLASQGITTGWDDGTYRPTTAINRDAMAVFIYRYEHLKNKRPRA